MDGVFKLVPGTVESEITSTCENASGEIKDIISEVDNVNTETEGESFNFDGAKGAIKDNLNSCKNVIENIKNLVTCLVDSHKRVQESYANSGNDGSDGGEVGSKASIGNTANTSTRNTTNRNTGSGNYGTNRGTGSGYSSGGASGGGTSVRGGTSSRKLNGNSSNSSKAAMQSNLSGFGGGSSLSFAKSNFGNSRLPGITETASLAGTTGILSGDVASTLTDGVHSDISDAANDTVLPTRQIDEENVLSRILSKLGIENKITTHYRDGVLMNAVEKIDCVAANDIGVTNDTFGGVIHGENGYAINMKITYDDSGYAKVGDKFVISCDETLGNIGDSVILMKDDGEAVSCIIGNITDSENLKNEFNFVVDNNKWDKESSDNISTELLENTLSILVEQKN